MKLTIRSKLLIGFVLVVLLSSIIQAFLIEITRIYIYSQVDARQTEKAQNAADAIISFFTEFSVHLKDPISLYKKGTPADIKELQAIMAYLIKSKHYMDDITFLTTSGRETVRYNIFSGQTADDKLSVEIATNEFLSAVSGKTAVTPVYYLSSPHQGHTVGHLDIYYPIFDKGAVTGVLKITVNLIQLWDVISGVKLGTNGYAYVVDSQGRLLAHPDSNLITNRTILSSRNVVSTLINNSDGKLSSNEYSYINEKGIEVIAKGSRVSGLNWYVIFEQPKSEAFAFWYFIRSLSIVTFFVTAAILLLISFSLSNRLTQPIQKLYFAARELALGYLDTRVAINTKDELEELGNTFNTMAKTLQESFVKTEEHKLRAEKEGVLLLRRDLDLREINDQLESEKEIISAEKNKLTLVLSGISDAVIAVDLNRKIILFNISAETLTGFSASDAIGKHINQIINVFDKNEELSTEEYCPIKADGFEGVVYKKQNIKIESFGKKQAFVNLTVGQIREGKRVNLGCILSMHNVTEEQKLEEMKIDFVSMAAHELRTPLTIIRGYTEVLKDKIQGFSNQDINTLIDRVVISSENLNSLIDNLLNVSRIEKNTFKIELSPIDLAATVENVVNTFKQQAETKQQVLTFQAEHELPLVFADSVRLTQVISNLLSNATSYTQRGGSIAVLVRRKDERFLEVSMADTGIGIPKEALPKLFTKFFRISGKLEEGSKGTGLGLFIAKSIITMHRGEISVESSVGKGSTFRFTLPIPKDSELKTFQLLNLQGDLTEKSSKGIIINKEAYAKRFGKYPSESEQ